MTKHWHLLPHLRLHLRMNLFTWTKFMNANHRKFLWLKSCFPNPSTEASSVGLSSALPGTGSHLYNKTSYIQIQDGTLQTQFAVVTECSPCMCGPEVLSSSDHVEELKIKESSFQKGNVPWWLLVYLADLKQTLLLQETHRSNLVGQDVIKSKQINM